MYSPIQQDKSQITNIQFTVNYTYTCIFLNFFYLGTLQTEQGLAE